MLGTSICLEEAKATSLVCVGGTRMFWKQESWREMSPFFLPPGKSLTFVPSPQAAPMSGIEKRQTQGQSPARCPAAVQPPELSPAALPPSPEGRPDW